jgi:hypothetical protein
VTEAFTGGIVTLCGECEPRLVVTLVRLLGCLPWPHWEGRGTPVFDLPLRELCMAKSIQTAEWIV